MHLAMLGTETVAYLLIANACDPGDNQILKPSPPFPSSTCTERERWAVSKYRDQHVPPLLAVSLKEERWIGCSVFLFNAPLSL